MPAHNNVPDADGIPVDESGGAASPIQDGDVEELGMCSWAGANTNAGYKTCGARHHDLPMMPNGDLKAVPVD